MVSICSPLRHRTLQTQIKSCGAGVSSRAHSGGVHGARRRIRGIFHGARALSPANSSGTAVVPPAHGGGSTAASPAGAQRRQRGSAPAAASPVDGGGKVTSLTKYLQLFPFLVVLVVYAVTVLFQDSRVR